jgi:hypothetical protein
MKTKSLNILIVVIFLLVLNVTFYNKLYAQTTGSLFMLPKNYNTQMLNPSYVRADNAIVFTVVGFGGATIGNNSNFNLSDFINKADDGSFAFDFNNLYKNGNSKNTINNWLTVPVFFIDIPFKSGRLSFSFRERFQSSLSFRLNEKRFKEGENSPKTFKTYYSDNIKYSGIGYQEIAVGYATKINKNISIGARGKVLFGAALAEFEDWNFGIDYTKNGDQIELRHKGTGKIELPVSFYLSGINRVLAVNSDRASRNYFRNFHNPGIGIDLGATIKLTEKSWLAVSATNIGVIWFRHNTMNIHQDTSFVFKNSDDIHNYISYNSSAESYIDPYNLIFKTKDKAAYLYRPLINTINTAQRLFPEITLHFQHNLFSNLSFAFTNQMVFYKCSPQNTLTYSILQRAGSFVFFESVNMYGTSNFTFGAGMQWEGRYAQLFAATDNLQAVFSTTQNKSFSMSIGIAFLLNKPNKQKQERSKNANKTISKRKKSKGKISPYFPFYKIKH